MSEAVKLLQAINTSMSRLVQLSGATGAGRYNSDPAREAAEVVQEQVNEQRLIRLREERIKLMKSEVMTATREAKTREEAQKAMAAVTREMQKLRSSTTNDITSMRNIKSVMQDFAKSVRGLSEGDLRKLSKNFDMLGGPMAGLSKAMLEGGDSVNTFISKLFENTEAMSSVLSEYDDLQKAIAKMAREQGRIKNDDERKLYDAKRRELMKRQGALEIS